MSHNNKRKSIFESFIFNILNSQFKKALVILLILVSFIGSIMMLPSKLVLAKMLPGKSTNTFSIYINTPSGSSIEQTMEVSQCIKNILQKEDSVVNIENFLGQGAPLDYAGLVKGSGMKKGEQYAEMVVNLTDKHTRDEKSFKMVQRLRPQLQQSCIPLVKGTNIKMIEMPAGPPTLASIVVEVYGKNNDKVTKLA